MMVREFLSYLKSELCRSEQTVNSYAEDLKIFEQFFKNLPGQISWDTIDSDVIRDWAESMMDKGNSAATVSRRLSAVRSLYRFALARHLVESDPAYRVKAPKVSKRLPYFLKEKQMDQLLDKQKWSDDYESVRARTIIILFYETGMRLSELIGLNDESVSFVRSEVKVLGKGNKQRIIPFGDELGKTLQEYIYLRDRVLTRKTAALFATRSGNRMSPASVREIVKENLARVCSLKKKSPHVLRHTFATAMLNHDAGIESLKKLLGHAKLSTTEIYTHTTFEQMKRVYKHAHPRA